MRRGAETGCSYCKWGRKRWKARSGTQRWAAYLSWHAAFPMIKPWTTQGGAGSFVPQAQLLSSHTLLPLAASLGHVFALCELELFFHCLTTNICFFYLSCPLIFHFRYLLFISLFYKKKSCQTLNRGQVFQPSSVKKSFLVAEGPAQTAPSKFCCLPESCSTTRSTASSFPSFFSLHPLRFGARPLIWLADLLLLVCP